MEAALYRMHLPVTGNGPSAVAVCAGCLRSVRSEEFWQKAAADCSSLKTWSVAHHSQSSWREREIA
jgi:hypothetical protein